MEKKIIKRNTFKEAFADVLNMSHEELIKHTIDHFINEAFNSFEEMDFSHENINNEFTLNSRYNAFPSYKSRHYYCENFLSTKKILLHDKIIHKNYIVDKFYVNTHQMPSHVVFSGIKHDSTENSAKEENEVQLWLLLAA
jgi:hypothetical protein